MSVCEPCCSTRRGGALLGNDDRDRRGSGLAALVWIIVAPVVALLLQLAISRSREYGADATGARLTGDPDALADALQRIELAAQQRMATRDRRRGSSASDRPRSASLHATGGAHQPASARSPRMRSTSRS